ncbi:uncharacterized protein EKO05_0003943 [Ascochyta rabiei]|uniref:uncharacterized protein n=1 Tax=Didymella rabiei TaxID=5454 RepID=UPI00220B549F|nr:uncharacterized protein EKO05_0003943 [Ascochyta rabiei]UPX13435.1 hypothetical protein EKO05_0003943 [Ascochyta rabiei]
MCVLTSCTPNHNIAMFLEVARSLFVPVQCSSAPTSQALNLAAPLKRQGLNYDAMALADQTRLPRWGERVCSRQPSALLGTCSIGCTHIRSHDVTAAKYQQHDVTRRAAATPVGSHSKWSASTNPRSNGLVVNAPWPCVLVAFGLKLGCITFSCS